MRREGAVRARVCVCGCVCVRESYFSSLWNCFDVILIICYLAALR